MGTVLKMPRSEPRPSACQEARRVTAMTAAYDALESFVAEVDQLRADNRRLKLELAAVRSQRDSCSNVSSPVGFTGGPVMW